MKTILMKTYNPSILLLLFLFLSATVLSQNSKLDSLNAELKMHIEKDTARVNLLNAISRENYRFDEVQMKQYADEANILAKDIGFIKGEARSLYLKGLYYLEKRELDSSRANIDQSLSLEKKSGNTAGVSKCYDIIATLYRYQDDYANSVLYYQKCAQIAKNDNDQLQVAAFLSAMGATYNVLGEFDDAETVLKESIAIYDSLNAETKVLRPLNNLALVYTQQGRHTEALSYFQKCLTGYRNEGNYVNGSAILLNMALVYSSMDQNDKALPYLKEGLEVAKEVGDELQISKFIIGIGYCHKYNKEYDKALEYYSQGLAICKRIDSKAGLYNCYNNIGGLHIEREEYEQALNNYKKGLEVSLVSSSKVGIAESYTQLGLIYIELGNDKKALENTLKGKEIADEISLVRTQAEANRLLSQLYEKDNNYEEALERFKDHKMYSDSLFNKERVAKITSLEYEYKYKQQLDSASIRELKLTKSVKTTSLKLEKSQEKYLWSIIGFLIVFMVLAGVIVYLRFRNIKSKTENIVMEQKLLRSQMTPHFIFNSLSVLQGMILNKEDKKSVTYLSKFSKLLRTILENSRDKTVLLAQELSAIENYLALQILQDNSYHYQIDVEAGIDVDLFEIPAMLIQPFVENSIEHAFPHKVDNQSIDICINFVNNKLICTITDNGIGINSQKQLLRKDKKSLATTITSERLKILSKDFKIHGAVTIVDRQKYNEKGTVVTLEIPYKLYKK